ncbi:MAG: TIGR00341 family protein [Armatimonadetes bacterium]|nr:TIGR00341 family protein [Armatimonadota bacterium]
MSEEPETIPAAILRQQQDIRRTIAVSSRISSPYLVMNALATVVAAYGLLANSTAVVIGAMIIATLIGPIMGLALALVDGDMELFRHSVFAELSGVMMVVSLGAIIGRIHIDLDITQEILSRTQPNILDLMVALAGGAAGAYATVSPRVSVGLVGVAISTALVPPLTACGICFSRGLGDLALGALILFTTNLVAIQCAASVVLFAFGYHKVTKRDPNDHGYHRRLVVDAALFVCLSIFLYRQFAMSVSEEIFRKNLRKSLEVGLRAVPGATLEDIRVRTTSERDIVVALVRVPNSITPQQTSVLQSMLVPRDSRQIELHVRSQLTKETTTEGYLHEIKPAAAPVDDPEVPNEELERRNPSDANDDNFWGEEPESPTLRGNVVDPKSNSEPLRQANL